MLKKCIKCEEALELSKFPIRTKDPLVYRNECKECTREQKANYYQKNKAQLDAKNKKWAEDNKEIYRKYHQEYYQKNKEAWVISGKKRREEKREEIREVQKEYYKKNREKTLRRVAEYRQTSRGKEVSRKSWAKRYSTPEGRLRSIVSGSIRDHLNGKVKNGRTFDYLPYTVDQLKEHLESQFLPGMSWDNHGVWHIDHKNAHSNFHYESLDHPDFVKCWALSNLQPMWKIDNLKKGVTIWEDFIKTAEGKKYSLTHI